MCCKLESGAVPSPAVFQVHVHLDSSKAESLIMCLIKDNWTLCIKLEPLKVHSIMYNMYMYMYMYSPEGTI